MAKKVELGQSGLGDISDILHNRGLSDLSWLDVDPEDYHKAEALPKQNLDVIPELQRALSMDDGGVPVLIPLRPHTMVNTNPLDPPGAPARNVAPQIRNTIAKHIIAGHNSRHIREQIELEFAPSQIRAASESVSSVLSERGLLGNVYVDARHFPRCAQDSDDKKFVATKAANAKFILAKDECSDCIHNRGGNCANLHKRLVENISYDRKMFAGYALQLAHEGRLDKENLDKAISGTNEDRKRVLQASFRSNPGQFRVDNGTQVTLRHQDKVCKPVVTDEQIVAHLNRPREATISLTRGFIAASKHLMFGGSPDIVSGSPDPEIRRLARDHGLLGHTYLDMEALGGCQKTLDFISRMDSVPDFVVRRSACCGECKDASDGACSQIKSISAIVDDVVVDREHFAAALLRAVDRGVITIESARHAAAKAPKNSNWRSLTAQANLLKAAKVQAGYTGAKISSHYGSTAARDSLSVDPVNAEDVRKTIAHLMNCGLHGKALKAAVLQKYAREDLAKVPHVGAQLTRHDGIQGSFFMDPTVYPDYGKGCSVGAKRFRKQGASNVMAGDACTGCSMQTAPGWCAKYAKLLIRQIPESILAAAAERRRFVPVMDDTPVENPVDHYELSSSIIVDPVKKPVSLDVSFSDRSLTK